MGDDDREGNKTLDSICDFINKENMLTSDNQKRVVNISYLKDFFQSNK
jgi:hypothetical protein